MKLALMIGSAFIVCGYLIASILYFVSHNIILGIMYSMCTIVWNIILIVNVNKYYFDK